MEPGSDSCETEWGGPSIVEWEPFTKMVTEDGTPDSLMGTTLVVYHLEETPSGTHLSAELGALKGRPRWMRMMLRTAAPIIKKEQTQAIRDFVDEVTADHMGRPKPATASPVVP